MYFLSKNFASKDEDYIIIERLYGGARKREARLKERKIKILFFLGFLFQPRRVVCVVYL